MRLWTVLTVLLCTGSLLAVTPGIWEHNSEADFDKGTFETTAASSLGEIRLARKIEVLVATESAPAVVAGVVSLGESVYFASGTESIVYKLNDDKAEKFAELPGTMVTTLIAGPDETLLVGVGGDDAGIYSVDSGGKVEKIWADPDVKYVWAIVPGSGGTLYAGTGPKGKVYAVDTSAKTPKAEEIYDPKDLAKNILSLVRLESCQILRYLDVPSEYGLLYAGTDQSGLVVEIDPRKKTSRVVLDAKEKEIAALLVDEAGGLYVATSDAAMASRDGKARPSNAKAGKAIKPEAAPAAPPAKQAEAPEKKKEEEGEEDTEEKSTPTTAPAESEQEDEEEEEAEEEEAVESVEPEEDSSPTQTQPASDKPLTKPLATSAPAGGESTSQPAEGKTKDAPKPKAATPAVTAATPPRGPGSSKRPTPSKRPSSAAPSGKGNAVYYIRPDGLVETRFRRPVTILSMLRDDQTLYLGTGNGGAIYSVSIGGDEIARLADTDAKQVTALAFGPEGEIFFGTGNKGSLGQLTGSSASSGTFTSAELDAKQLAQWGTMRVRGQTPGQSKLTIATRSGNVAKADDDTWSDWSKEHPVDGFVSIGSPAGRLLQYRLTLTAEGEASPVVQQVQLIYQVGNLPPVVSALTVNPSDKGTSKSGKTAGQKAFRHLAIKAVDLNKDKLTYTVEFRELGAQTWIQIAEDLTTPKHIWDTRTVADGLYELRVVASDSPSNPHPTALTAGRISDPVLVDNTPPLVEQLGARPADGAIVVSGTVTDASSRIVSMYYSVDSQDKWTALGATDGIADSTSEAFRFELTDLEPGAHRIALKVLDLYGNVGYASIAVTVAE